MILLICMLLLGAMPSASPDDWAKTFTLEKTPRIHIETGDANIKVTAGDSANGATATFDSFTVANSDTLVKYTWYGDTDELPMASWATAAAISPGTTNAGRPVDSATNMTAAMSHGSRRCNLVLPSYFSLRVLWLAGKATVPPPSYLTQLLNSHSCERSWAKCGRWWLCL